MSRQNEFEQELSLRLSRNERSYIYQLERFIAEQPEHTTAPLIPLYNRIIKAQDPDEIRDLTTHRRWAVRYAALDKIAQLEGEILPNQKVTLNDTKYPMRGWNFPNDRHRQSGGGGYL